MGFTIKKYRVSQFFRKLVFFESTKAYHLWILCQNFNFLKTYKNLYMGSLCVTGPKYGLYDQEI
jgi:hypothetical protein